MKSFNTWMNEPLTANGQTDRRYKSFSPKIVPHPIVIADHTWSECAKEYTLRLDSFLTQFRLLFPDDVRATGMINKFKEELIKTMVENSQGFEADETPVHQETPGPQEHKTSIPGLKLI